MNLDDAHRELKRHFEDASDRSQIAEHVLIYHAPTVRVKGVLSISLVPGNHSIRIMGIPERTGDLAAVATHLRQGDILFIGSIHQLPQPVCAMLADVMATFMIRIEVGKGRSANEVTLQLPQFTVIGATSQPSLLPDTLQKSFQKQVWIEGNDEDSLTQPERVR